MAVLLQRRGGRGGVLVSRVAEVRRWCRDDGGAAGVQWWREEVDRAVVRTTNLVQAGVVDLVRRPWW